MNNRLVIGKWTSCLGGMALVNAFLFPCEALARTTVEVKSGETLSVTAAEDSLDRTILAHGGSIVSLSGDRLKSYLVLTNGEVTLQAPGGVRSIHLDTGLFDCGGGSLKVDGPTRLTLGKETAEFAYLGILAASNISFTASTGVEGLVLTNRLLLVSCPPRESAVCPVAVAKGTVIGFNAAEGVRALCGEETDLAHYTVGRNWNFLWLSNRVFPSNSTVTVSGGATLYVKSCGVDLPSYSWAGVRATDTENTTGHNQIPPFSNVTNIVLASDENGRAVFYDQNVREFDFMGEISGEGDYVKNGCFQRERTNLRGLLTFRGNVTLTGDMSGVIVSGHSFGDPSNEITLAGTGNRLQVLGQYPTETNRVYIASLEAMKESHEFYIFHQGGMLTWEIGRLHSTAIFNCNETFPYVYQVNRLMAGSCPIVTGVATLRILSADEETRIVAATFNGTKPILDLRDFEGVVPPIEIRSGATLTILGAEGKTLRLSGEGQVRDGEGKSIPINAVTEVYVPTNTTQTLSVPDVIVTNWAAKVAQWYDASASETLGGYPKDSNGSTPTYRGHVIINRWGDRRYGTNVVHLYNGRSISNTAGGGHAFGDRCDQVNPYVVKGGLNGLDYLSFGTYQKPTDAENRNVPYATEARRLTMVTPGSKGNITSWNTNLVCACAILVYGSANGGGKAILGMNGWGYRSGTTTNHAFYASGSASSMRTIYVDGVAVDGTVAKPNGSWQILTLPVNGQRVSALGWNNTYETSGGQDYAEVILFDEMPTDMERRACETYLAKKWGLLGQYRGQQTVLPVLDVTGGGSLVVAADAELRGAFHGDVTVGEGVTLALTDRPLPPDETVVPATNRVVWFDPDVANALHQDSSDRPLNVSALRERNEAGAIYLHRVGSGLSSGCDRRPWADHSVHGEGVARTWLDFGNLYADVEKSLHKSISGNTLRMQTTWKNSTDCNPIGGVREGFIVLDTVNGGGTPVGENINMSTTKRGGTYGRSVSSPIWPKQEGVFTNVTTWLDGTTVNGFTKGFNGRPEVLGFAFQDAWQVGAFGAYSQTDGSSLEHGGLIMGEALFYSNRLDTVVRRQVTAYLAHKWFGKVLEGYADLTRLSVKGAGRVTAVSMENLPQFDPSFTGTLDLQNADLAFTIDTAKSATTATDVWNKPGTLELGADDTVTVSFASTVGGDSSLTLVERCTLAGGALPALKLSGAAEFLQPHLRPNGTTRLRLVLKNGSLVLYVPPKGLVLMVK